MKTFCTHSLFWRRDRGITCAVRSAVVATAVIASAACVPIQAQQPAGRVVATPRIDARAVALLEHANRTLFTAQTLRGKIQTFRTVGGAQASTPVAVDVWAAKPRLFRVNEGATLAAAPAAEAATKPSPSTPAGVPQLSGVTSLEGGRFEITGEALEAMVATMKATSRQVRIHRADRSFAYSSKDSIRMIDTTDFINDVAEYGLQMFFGLQQSRIGVWTPNRRTSLLLRSLIYAGKEVWRNKQYDIVEWRYANAYVLPLDTIAYTTRFFVGSDHVIHRSITASSTGLQVDRHFDLELNATVTDLEFAVPDSAGVITSPRPTTRTSLLGQSLPPLSPGAVFLDGQPFMQNAFLTGKKGALLWLWSSGCSSATAEFPIVEQWLREFGSRGVSVIGLSYAPGDEQRTRIIRQYYQAKAPIVFGATSWTDAIIKSNSPVVILDAGGTVVYHGRFDENAIRDVLERLTSRGGVAAQIADRNPFSVIPQLHGRDRVTIHLWL